MSALNVVKMTTLERQSLFSQEILASQNRSDWLKTVSAMAQTLGFSHVTLMKVPCTEEKLLAPIILETTLPASFIRAMDEHSTLLECPILGKIAHSSIPQYWSMREEVFSSSVCQVIKDGLARQGIDTGVIAPINFLNGRRYVLRFEGRAPKPSQAVLNEIGIISIHAFDVYDRVRKAEMAVPRSLTKREIEVIRWTSHGKTSSEIGQILSLSDHTINAYLNNAIKKLDCVNRTQLDAKAILLKVSS